MLRLIESLKKGEAAVSVDASEYMAIYVGVVGDDD